jgi:hypothetical protein
MLLKYNMGASDMLLDIKVHWVPGVIVPLLYTSVCPQPQVKDNTKTVVPKVGCTAPGGGGLPGGRWRWVPRRALFDFRPDIGSTS